MGFSKEAMRRADTPVMAFFNFISPQMLERIVENTNFAIETMSLAYDRITRDDIKKCIGASLLIGLLKGKNMKVREFWSEKYGQSMIKIGIGKYETITQCIRFDRRNTRNNIDKLAPIRIFWEMLIENCIKNYKPSEQVIVV